jgi:hypothetical protein
LDAGRAPTCGFFEAPAGDVAVEHPETHTHIEMSQLVNPTRNPDQVR